MTSLDKIRYKIGEGKERSANFAWFRGSNCNYYPTKENLYEEDYEKYFMLGLSPEAPFIDLSTKITVFGSCFALNIARHLGGLGYTINNDTNIKVSDTHIALCSDAFVNTFSIVQQFEWALLKKSFPANLWYTKHGELARPKERIRKSTRDLFVNTDVFIFTLGLSEVWFLKQTGDVLWRAIPRKVYKENRDLYDFRLSTVQENTDNLQKTIDIIKKFKPKSKIIITLSPVPLLATFRPCSCIVSDCVSKSILRVAIDNIIQKKMEGVYYFPSYEFNKYNLENPYTGDNRHIRPELLETIYNIFDKHYLVQK